MRAFLEGRIHQLTTAYELAITSYALSRAGSNIAAISYSKLEKTFKVEKGKIIIAKEILLIVA